MTSSDKRGLVVPFPRPRQVQAAPARAPQQRCRPVANPKVSALGAEDSHPHARAIARRGSYEEAVELAREGHETVRRSYHDVNRGLRMLAEAFMTIGKAEEAQGFLQMVEANQFIVGHIR